MGFDSKFGFATRLCDVAVLLGDGVHTAWFVLGHVCPVTVLWRSVLSCGFDGLAGSGLRLFSVVVVARF